MHWEHTDLVPHTFSLPLKSPKYTSLSFMQGYEGRFGLEVKPRSGTDSVGNCSELSVTLSKAVRVTESSAAPSPYRQRLGQSWIAKMRRWVNYHSLRLRRLRDVEGHEGATILIDPLNRSISEIKCNHYADEEIGSRRFRIALLKG